MPGANCAVSGCNNTKKNTKFTTPMVTFYSFPSRSYEAERKIVWTNFVKRKNPNGSPWMPTKNSKICSVHFIGNMKSQNPNDPSFNPTIYHPLKIPVEKVASKQKRPDESFWKPKGNSRICSRHFVGNSNSVNPTSESYNPTIHPSRSGCDKRDGSKRILETEPETGYSEMMDTTDNSEKDKEIQCFVCLESNEVNYFNKDSLNIATKIPDRVMDRLKKKLSEDIIESLKNPNSSMVNCFCKTCLLMSNKIFDLSCKLEMLKAQIENSVNEYASRIISCRKEPEGEDIKPLIRVSQDCFEDDYGDDCDFPEMANEDSNNFSNKNGGTDIHDQENFQIPSNSNPATSTKALGKSNTFSSQNLNSSQGTSKNSRKCVRLSKRIESGVSKRRNEGDIFTSKFGLKEFFISMERIQPYKLRCNICYKIFSSSTALNSHKDMHIHLLKLKCPNCQSQLTEKSQANVPVKLSQCYMSCDGCKNGFVFEKRIGIFKSGLAPIPLPNKNVDSRNENNVPEVAKTSNPKKTELKTYTAKISEKPVEQGFCKICNIPVVKSMLKFHMKHYHPKETVPLNSDPDPDPDVEVVAVKIENKLIVKKPKPPVPMPIIAKQPKEVRKSDLKCMTCNNQLIYDVPEVNKQQLRETIEKFPDHELIYCSHCKKAFVVGGRKNKKVSINIKERSNEEKELIKSLSEYNTIKCTECSGYFATQYMACMHKNFKCKNIKRSCHLCDKSFQFAYDLKHHVKDNHPDMDMSLWNICSKCGDSYSDVKVHSANCTGTLGKICGQCGHVCSSDQFLLSHIQKSHGQARKEAGKERQSSFKTSKRLCENCGKQYTDFKRHMRGCGKKSGKKFECTLCHSYPLVFESRRKLKMHDKIYHNVAVHRCALCARVFAKFGHLKRHRIMSHGIKI